MSLFTSNPPASAILAEPYTASELDTLGDNRVWATVYQIVQEHREEIAHHEEEIEEIERDAKEEIEQVEGDARREIATAKSVARIVAVKEFRKRLCEKFSDDKNIKAAIKKVEESML